MADSGRGLLFVGLVMAVFAALRVGKTDVRALAWCRWLARAVGTIAA